MSIHVKKSRLEVRISSKPSDRTADCRGLLKIRQRMQNLLVHVTTE
jgi:hypothetical protein